jgi:hypothetical protein
LPLNDHCDATVMLPSRHLGLIDNPVLESIKIMVEEHRIAIEN